MGNITLKELESIILERNGSFSDVGLNPEIFDKEGRVDFIFKKFKKHNRLDCTLWLSIFPFDFKIKLDKENHIIKKPFIDENKNIRVFGKRLLI